ncbi:DUF3667 domain-containing protein [Flavobacterium paronense]|uniref:DUF3667 domain-containing protein n=1 Tax=Flavobacterium paronense TaxID=1392775 RepID=A0ABV5GCF0_9FLAO|nr:DUF3667 domain-containing protein [Flavobacterium paronense]MDN3677909.1 DUF3667 domain-containing protein [Flavobacterium paronense]
MQYQLCQNCETKTEGNFCSNCGQKTNTIRLNWHYLKDEINYTFLHVNKGLIYTAKQLLVRPGHTVREFIDGKRIKHYKPVLLLFVIAGINGILMHYIPIEEFINNKSSNGVIAGKQVQITKLVFDWLSKHYSLYEIIVLPIYAFCSWLAFKKYGYNYIENIIINSFAASQRLIIGIIFFPIELALIKTPYFKAFNVFSTFVSIGFTVWMILQLYQSKSKISVIKRMFYFLFIISIVFIFLMIALGIVYAYCAHLGYVDKSLITK